MLGKILKARSRYVDFSKNRKEVLPHDLMVLSGFYSLASYPCSISVVVFKSAASNIF